MEVVKERPKRRPLVRAASEESSSDLSSVSYAPAPGDTLPWNLPKHHRIKRSKSASGDVLDPAERAVIRIAGKVENIGGREYAMGVDMAHFAHLTLSSHKKEARKTKI